MIGMKTLAKLLFTEHPDFVPPERDTEQLKLVRKVKNFSLVLVFHLLQITFVIAPTFTQELGRSFVKLKLENQFDLIKSVNVITELGMSSNQVVGLMLIKMLVEIFFRPIAARVKLSVFDLCVGWSLAHLVQMSLYSFSSTFTYFAVGAVLFGIGNAFGHGLKLVLVIDCLGQQNLRPYLGRALDELNI